MRVQRSAGVFESEHSSKRLQYAILETVHGQSTIFRRETLNWCKHSLQKHSHLRFGKEDVMGAIAALVLSVFVAVLLIGTIVADVRQQRNIKRSAMSDTERDRRSTNRLAA